MTEIAGLYALLERLPDMRVDELIRLKWAAERLALECRKEREHRDAMAVDEAIKFIVINKVPG